MSRTQVLTTNVTKTIALAATPEVIVASQIFVKSVVIQALVTNTDFLYIGDSTRQLFALSPGRSLTIQGDNMDNGTSGKVDLNTIWAKVNVNGEGLNFVYLAGL